MRFSKLRGFTASLLLFPTLALANVLGTDAQNFVPTTDGIDFVTVHSSETLRPGYLNFGLFLNFADNTLPAVPGKGPNYSDSLLSSDMNLGVGIMKDWDAGISIPALLHQNVTDAASIGGNFSQTGITEIRMNTKYRFWGDDSQGIAAVASLNVGLIENNPYTGSGGGPTFNFEAVYNHRFGDVDWAANIGHRWRDPGTPLAGVPIQPIHNQWIASTGASYLVENWDTKFILEIYGAVPQSSGSSDANNQQTVFEGLLGAKHDFTPNLAGQLGIGRKLDGAGIASPSFRIYAGVNYAWGALWGKESPEQQAPLEKATAVPMAPMPADETPTEPVLDNDHFVTRALHFKTNSTELEVADDSTEVLTQLVAALSSAPYKRLLIEGHTDSIGSAKYNKKLSERRAQAIRKILIKQFQVDGKKVKAAGYGKTQPIASNGNFQGRELNRRVEFKIIRE